jgi:hypothetical protein
MIDADAIAKRAYELYLARGSEPGHETEDWLRAEAELTAKASDTNEERQSTDGEESEPANDPRASRKRTNGSRRVARQPQPH